MKYKLIICFLILSTQVLNVSASIKPIIVTTMPDPVNSGLQNLDLHWTVIDDNPRNFVLSINNTVWKNESLQSNEINVVFSNPYGWYNISLKVIDFSGNVAYANLYINMSPVFPITNSAITSNSTNTSIYNDTNASPGYEYLVAVPLLVVFSTYTLVKRKISKR